MFGIEADVWFFFAVVVVVSFLFGLLMNFLRR
jgi:hypothetical protein